MEGRDVTVLQSMLLLLEYPVGKLDGYYGTQTQDAVIAFQKDHNIPADGTVGPITKQKLITILSDIPDRSDFRIYDRLIATGTSYEVSPFFAEGQSHEFTISSDSPHISIDGITITGLSSGSAEVYAECDGRKTSFFFSIRDGSEIDTRVGDAKNANNLGLGLRSRLKGLESYSGDLNSLVLLAGDCFLDERLFMTDFDDRFAGKNIYSVALAGSMAEQWLGLIPKISRYQPVSMVFAAGINEIRHGKTVLHLIGKLEELFGMIHEYMPETTIYWWNILPHFGTDEEYWKIAAVNAAIQEYSEQDDRLVVVDCYTEVTDKNGVAEPSLYRDAIHPNSAGYDRLFRKTCEAGLKIPEK